MNERRGRAAGPHRAGFAALLGPPNAGKSTLLNHLIGQKLAIVTAKPQTTRSRILGILNRPDAQLLLVDTPGLHEGARPLNVALNEAVHLAAENADVALLLVDRTRGWCDLHDTLFEGLRSHATPTIIVATKCDLPPARGLVWPPPQVADTTVMLTSAVTGEGIDALLDALVAALPESPALYPEETLTDRPLRWLAGELVREAVFECLGQELPYAMAVEVVAFEESRPDLTRIRANVLVERNSQKRIVVGTGGQMIKRIGVSARHQIETLVGTRVHLELFVKIDPRWLKNPRRIESLGYN